MASGQALGGALSYNPFLPAEQNAKMYQIQQQQALANALLAEGMKPVDINNRMMGQIAYNISPLEPLAKLAEALSGRYASKQASEDYGSMFNPQSSGSDGQSAQPGGGGGIQQGSIYSTPQTGGGVVSPTGIPSELYKAAQMGNPEAQKSIFDLMASNAKYTDQMKNFQGPAFSAWQKTQTQPGYVSTQTELGKNYAGALPYGTPPEGAQGSATSAIPNQNPYLQNLVNAESGGDPNAISPVGAQGLTQVMPNTGVDPGFGVKPLQNNSPEENLRFGNDYLNAMQNRYGDPRLAAAAYNAGPSRVDKALSMLPKETQDYVPKVVPPNMMMASNAPQQPQPEPRQAAFMPPSLAGMSADQAKVAMEVAKAGATTRASEHAKNTEEAVKGAATIDSRIDNAKSMINEMLYGKDKSGQVLTSGNTNNGVAANATYGPMSEYHALSHDMWNDDTSVSNAKFQQLNANLFTQELPGIVAASGGRVDIPLINAIQDASAVPLHESPSAKIERLHGLADLLEKVRENAHNQVGNVTGESPTLNKNYQTPQQIQQQFPGAKQAPDGHFYIQDPNRQSKFLRIDG